MGINVPANKRRVGFLFQNYALWPNMTVYENISFGLTNVKEALPKIDFDTRVNARLAEILSAPGEVTKVLAECRDKKGKLDDKKALLKAHRYLYHQPVHRQKAAGLPLGRWQRCQCRSCRPAGKGGGRPQ